MAVGFVSLWLSVALSYFNLVRAFAGRRLQPQCCILAARFLQSFINKLVQLALASGASLANVIKLPANMAADFGRGPVPEESALHPLPVSSAGLFDFTSILACPDGECVKAAWSHYAVAVDAHLPLHATIALLDLMDLTLPPAVAWLLMRNCSSTPLPWSTRSWEMW